MKKFFSLALLTLMMVASKSFAQSSLLATLSHDGEISTFYGAKALQDAHNAAVNGDVITLSSGTFNAVNITKAVTIRGAGMEVDSLTNTLPTILSGDFVINIADAGTDKLTMEGLYHNSVLTNSGTLKNAMFLKCRLSLILNASYAIMNNASFIHCKIANTLQLDGSCSCVNSVVSNPKSQTSTTSNFEMTNCIILCSGSGDIGTVYSSSFINCILYDLSTSHYVASSTTAYNNIAFAENEFRTTPNTTNKVVSNITDVFKTFTGTYSDSESFLLTDEAKAAYLGTDGKEVGLYGGSLPFSPTPTNPQITKCEVAAKSTADGKLSVDIVVNGAE